MIRQVALATIAVFAILAQVAVGLVGPGGGICVCSTCVAIETHVAACDTSVPETCGADGVVVIGDRGCSDCHLIPLPHTDYAPTVSVPTHPVAAVVPSAPVLESILVWPPPPASRSASYLRQRTPPNQYLRVLRSVVLTC